MPSRLPVRLAAFFALGLGACQSPAEVPPAAKTAAETPAETAVAPAVIEIATPATAALPPVPTIDDDPQRLYGLDRGALGILLGAPELIRREAPAEIWQYRGRACVFDVFLYEEAGAARVSYVEARDAAAQPSDARACLNQLLRARQNPPLG